jgi:non-specific serine/threonine protein kinase
MAGHLRVQASSAAALGERIREWKALVILDNCEHLAEDCARLAGTLLDRAPEVRILATSRQPLRVPGEVVFSLAPLSLPTARSHSTHDPSDAVTLFIDRAERFVPGYDCGPHLATIGEICIRLDGLPLAIELAAAWLPVLSPPAILHRLGQPLELLTQGSPVDVDRHRTLSASISWSYNLCTPDERTLWRHLSSFLGGFGLEEAEFVASLVGVSRERCLDGLAGLARKSVIARQEVDGIDWFRMLVALRDFGLAMLDIEDERRDAYRYLLAFNLDFVQRAAADWYSPRQAEWLARCLRAMPNVRQALEFALTEGNTPEAVFGLTTPLWRGCWLAQGRMDELRRWLERAITSTSVDDEPRLMAVALHAYATGMVGGGLSTAGPLFDAVRVRADRVGAVRVVALVDVGIATLLPNQQEAIPAYESFLAFAENDPQALALSGVPVRLALLYDRVGDAERASRLISQIVSFSEDCGERFERSYLMFGLGANALGRGDLGLALDASRDHLRLAEGMTLNMQTAHAVETIAAASQLRGEAGYAATLLGVADRMWHTLGTDATAFPQPTADRPGTEGALLKALGSGDFQRDHDRGRELSLEDGIQLAIDPGRSPAQRTVPSTDRARSEADRSPGGSLTAREVEVARLVAQGLSDRAIASRLVISPRTAQGHVQKALVKLGLTSRTELALWFTERDASSS